MCAQCKDSPYHKVRRAKRRRDSDVSSSTSSSDSSTSGYSDSTSSNSSNSSVSSDSDSEGSTDLACEVEERARSVATTLAQDKQQPVSQPPPETLEGPAVATSAPMDHLWDWVLASAPNSVKKYHEKLRCNGFDTVCAITLLRPEDFQRYDMPFGHRAQLVHHAKET